MRQTYDVIIAGAGPVGLFLACDLALARASVLVLERDITPSSPWKRMPFGRRGMNMQANEAFHRRGLFRDVVEPQYQLSLFQKTDGFQFAGHFAGLGLNANRLDLDRYKHVLSGPALLPVPTTLERIESTLAARAESLGATIIRGAGFSEVSAEDEKGVTVTAGDNQTFRGRWLVGCDGGRSLVRKAAGIHLVGTEPQFTGYIVQCEYDDPSKLQPDMNLTENGVYIYDPEVLYIADFDGGAYDRSQELTLDHIQRVLRRISGVPDITITKLNLASSFTDRCKQAVTYRRDRVLLAGDAAHIHSPLGAQGLNLGIGDAINLGWKLGATVQREKQNPGDWDRNMALLNTYEMERKPVGERVLDWSRAQVSSLRPGPHGTATYELFKELLNTVDGTNIFIDRLWGLTQRYASSGTDSAHLHDAVGRSAPDLEFDDGSRLGQKLASGKGLLISLAKQTGSLQLLLTGSSSSRLQEVIDYVELGAKDKCGLQALLVRPDGVVAWAADEGNELDLEALATALDYWFGR
ncbi:hypothetical protein QQS21_006337 [Conoideocrella luteorostrata]|uniref:FAD-binding domain-containing protein n=1 Tax=Conoideocrella luteorostrata TaxID=1105319 RepID=A0AAJ0FTJ4_9HYPO|nr:hypothetical protein QQS21_006337 [Conoideocrella luteorostrata]